MELGIVSFFNVERGFGRIQSPKHPKGLFVHFSDVQSEARILVPHELVKFQLRPSPKGPKAVQVARLTERLQGQIVQFSHGFGFVQVASETFFLHHHDFLGQGFKQIDTGMTVEFSPFADAQGLQAKEVILTDPRSPLERFAWLGTYERHIQQLAELAENERWDYPFSTQHRFPILRSYLEHSFRRLEQEGNILIQPDAGEGGLACFNTGLLSAQQEEIYAYFGANHRRKARQGYLPPQAWVLRCFATESHHLRSHFPARPLLPSYAAAPGELVFDPSYRLIPDLEHILQDRHQRFPTALHSLPASELAERFNQAIRSTEQQARRNYRLAIPQFYEGQIQLLLPLCLEESGRPDLALVISREHEIYRAHTILPLEWAYQNARLIAPQDDGWLRRAMRRTEQAVANKS